MTATSRTLPAMDLAGVRIPRLIYGTAWKEARTEPLVAAALRAGFRGIDTANQRKHYHEAGVGAALREAFDAGIVRREDLFVQTKFTFLRGQDHRLPYDPEAPTATQVAQSCASSREHLGVQAIDAYLLHGPSRAEGIGEEDVEAWRAMEALHDEKSVRLLGLSNVSLDQLAAIHHIARVKPAIVQNRTFTRPHADGAVRAFCAEHGLAYEGFSLLTAIPRVLAHPTLDAIALRVGRTPAEVVFAWCLARGLIVLTGTSSPEHMAQDLSVPGIALSEEELATVEALVA